MRVTQFVISRDGASGGEEEVTDDRGGGSCHVQA